MSANTTYVDRLEHELLEAIARRRRTRTVVAGLVAMTIAAMDHSQMIGVSNHAMSVPRIGMMLIAPNRPGAAANAITRNVSAKSALVAGSGMTLVPTAHTSTAHRR